MPDENYSLGSMINKIANMAQMSFCKYFRNIFFADKKRPIFID